MHSAESRAGVSVSLLQGSPESSHIGEVGSSSWRGAPWSCGQCSGLPPTASLRLTFQEGFCLLLRGPRSTGPCSSALTSQRHPCVCPLLLSFPACPPSLLLPPGITSPIKSVHPRPNLSSTFGEIKRQHCSHGMILHVGAALSNACLFHESMSSLGAPWVCFAHHRILNIVLTHSRCSINPYNIPDSPLW